MSQFIEELAPYAIKHGTVANVLPSLIIAQGVLESGSGTSSLAQNSNNLFGIKTGAWEGEVFSIVTKEHSETLRLEQPETDGWYEIQADFRKYPSYEGAVIDLCEKYTKMSRYSKVPGQLDFRTAAQAVKDAGYATDPNYPAKLINIYESYNLAQYDINFPGMLEFLSQQLIEVVDQIEEIVEEITKEENAMVIRKVAVDAGHGLYTAGKRTPAGEREWSFNNKVALALIAYLNTFQDVQVLRVDDPTGKTDVGLTARTNRANAWGADIYVSIHHNANTGNWGTWSGVETFVMTGSSASSGSMKLAKLVHPKVVSAMGLKDRGIKAANFAVLRQTKMPAILTEGGYMDSTIDIVKMRNDAVMRNQGTFIAEGIASYFGLTKKPSQASRPIAIEKPEAKGYLINGDEGGAVQALQTNLNKLANTIGITKLTVDGKFGDGTEQAVRKFQAYYKLEADGIYGKGSATKMEEELLRLDKELTVSYYRVRKAWEDTASQKGAFTDIDGAIAVATKFLGHNVYDPDGKLVYDSAKGAAQAEAAAKAEAEAEARRKEAERVAAEAKAQKEKAEEEARLNKEKALAEAKAAQDRMNAEFAEAIALGITDGSNPDGPATRKQVAVMIVRAMKQLNK